MAKDSSTAEKLNTESRKRLETLASHWTKAPDGFGLSDLTLPDLRLLLEHFAPLQELIRHIAAPAQATAPTADDQSYAAPPTATLQAMEQLQTQLQQAQTDLQQIRSEYSHLTSQCQAAQRDLLACNAAWNKLLQEKEKLQQEKEKLQQNNKTLKQDCKQLDKQLQQAQEQLSAFQNQGTPELAVLRGDPDLAQRLDLSNLPSDDTQALIQAVAVLAQRENLERLWSALKDRCEAENRPASMPERALLETALVWHNHNWRTRPYRLMEVMPPSAYHFENHLRSRQTPTGETVATLDLPGIADSSGAPLCKVLVRTR